MSSSIPRTAETAKLIALVYPKDDVIGRSLIITLRAKDIIGQCFRDILDMDITPEVRERIQAMEEELEADREFVNNA